LTAIPISSHSEQRKGEQIAVVWLWPSVSSLNAYAPFDRRWRAHAALSLMPDENSLFIQINSLFHRKFSLFGCVGNSVKEANDYAWLGDESEPITPGIAKIPCIFPGYQGITHGEWFATPAHRFATGGEKDCILRVVGCRSDGIAPLEALEKSCVQCVDHFPNRHVYLPAQDGYAPAIVAAHSQLHHSASRPLHQALRRDPGGDGISERPGYSLRGSVEVIAPVLRRNANGAPKVMHCAVI
jgi:hypothetical protein